MKDIARLIDRGKSTVTVLVNKLEKLNLVKRVSGSDDKRFYLITLTEEGMSLQPHLKEISDKLLSRIYSDMSELEKEILNKLLEKIERSL